MTKEGSPWRSYERIHQLRLGVGDRIHVAERKSPPFDIVTVRSWPGPHIEDKLHMLQQIQHPNFVSAFDAFDLEQSLCIVFEHMPISLQYVADNPYINELRLASVLGQVIGAISYLASQNLVHGSITCSNILLTKDGVIKIANCENCTERSSENAFEDVKALGQVMKQLMEMGAKNGRPGLQQPSNWSQEAVDFLSLTMTASPTKLAKHPFLQNSPQSHELVWLISLAQRSASFFTA
ncbi:kinase-like domain-containing protein [Dendryphion nanum]|uniref:Kinase-like domain-containing protein n=1 Tax=Dendryphion nanum TaxID=256645 RepID=A0A9P9I815_9PLEO|nr:kinase-like domain-containing protein [Dendryphion nanum]